MRLSDKISEIIENQGRSRSWVAERADIKYRTFLDKLERNSFSGEELLKLGRVLNIDLNKMKEEISWINLRNINTKKWL